MIKFRALASFVFSIITLSTASAQAGTVFRCNTQNRSLQMELLVDVSDWSVILMDIESVYLPVCHPKTAGPIYQLNCALNGYSYEVIYNHNDRTVVMPNLGTFHCKD